MWSSDLKLSSKNQFSLFESKGIPSSRVLSKKRERKDVEERDKRHHKNSLIFRGKENVLVSRDTWCFVKSKFDSLDSWGNTRPGKKSQGDVNGFSSFLLSSLYISWINQVSCRWLSWSQLTFLLLACSTERFFSDSSYFAWRIKTTNSKMGEKERCFRR